MRAAARLGALRLRLAEEQIPAIVVTDIANVAYLTAFEHVFDTEPAHAAVVTADLSVLYTDSRYAEAARKAAEGTSWEIRVPRENLYITLCADLSEAGVGALALETSVPFGRFRFISEQFKGNVEPVDQWVEELRQVKESDEIERIEAAQALTDAAFTHLLSVLRPGMTEREIALELEVHMRRNGSDGVAFAPIVAAGENSAKPHAQVSDRAIAHGDFVVLDFGARVDGYCADMTRTVLVGEPTDRHREIYDIVRAANAAGAAAVRPGLPGKDIDAAARAVIDGAGYGEYFGHGLGHGVGLEVHELPGVGARASKSVLEGSVITIEPGIYIPGFGGVRIEDLAVVGSDGCRVLTTSTKDLVII